MLRPTVGRVWDVLAVPYHVGTIALAGFAFVVPFLSSVQDDPTNEAGIYAALVALSMAGLIFSESVRWGRPSIRRIRRPAIAACAIGSSYLWLVGETVSDPTKPDLPLAILLVWALSLAAVAIPILVIITNTSGRPDRVEPD